MNVIENELVTKTIECSILWFIVGLKLWEGTQGWEALDSFWRPSWSVVIHVQGIGLLLHINLSKVTMRRVGSSEVDFCNWTTILLWLRRKSRVHPLLRKFAWFSHTTVLRVKTIFLKKTKGTRDIFTSCYLSRLPAAPPTIILHLNTVYIRV